MTIESLRVAVDSATMRRNPDGSSEVICPLCPAVLGARGGPYVQRFAADDIDQAEATLRAHTVQVRSDP